MFKSHKKLNKGIKNNTLFIVMSIILAFSFYFLFSNGIRSYESKLSIIVLPQSQVSAALSDEIIKNIEKISENSGFYDKLISDSKVNKEEIIGSSEKSWKNQIKVDYETGSILNITIRNENRAVTNMLADQFEESLNDAVGNYYRIGPDFKISTLTIPTKAQLSGSFGILILSLILGFVAANVIEYIAKVLDEKLYPQANEDYVLKFPNLFDSGKKKNLNLNSTLEELNESLIFGEKLNSEKEIFNEEKKEKDIIPERKEEEVNNESKKVVKKSNPPENLPTLDSSEKSEDVSAPPTNLPVGDINSINMNIKEENVKKQDSEDQASENEKSLSTYYEPTEEDYKKRLNQLLQGDL